MPAVTETKGITPTTITGYALVALGVVGGLGGAMTRPDAVWPYVIGGLLGITVGLAMIAKRPTWLPVTAAWATVAASAVYCFTLGWDVWLALCAVIVIVAIGALATWLIVRR